jgi:hypothetical protein
VLTPTGIAWGDAKQLLFERIDREVAPMRERYHALMADPGKIEAILQAGAHKARAEATPFMGELRQAVGLRNLGTRPAAPGKAKAAKSAAPAFKQYREKDGLFYFKLQDAEARVLLQSQRLRVAPGRRANDCRTAKRRAIRLGSAAGFGAGSAPAWRRNGRGGTGPEVFCRSVRLLNICSCVVVFLDQRSEKIPVLRVYLCPKVDTLQLCSIANRNNTSDMN